MKLKKLIEGLELKAYRLKDLEITNLCSHSKFVAPGDLFIAKKGYKEDGHHYIAEAKLSGALAVLCDFYDPFEKEMVQLVCSNIQHMEAELAARFFGNPSHALHTVGITGTNGKTTTAYLVKHLLDRLNISCGLIGTIEYIIGTYHFEAKMTTPDILTNQKLLKEMVKIGCKAAVMEVSSHGLSQERVSKIDFDVAIFSNLSQDHLDYHETIENYAKEKSKLFSLLKKEGVAILNLESPWAEKMVENCKAKRLYFGFSPKADLYAKDIHYFPNHTEFTLCTGDQKVKVRWNLIGKFNVLNCLSAVLTCLSYGASLNEISSHIETFQTAPGRLEKVENLANLQIFIDYAHKPGALENVLNCLKEIKQKRILTVFGCGGDRDRGKRKMMAEISDRFSDFTWITSDNPRSEDPREICLEIAKGFSSKNYEIEVDRRTAIEKAVKSAHPEDLILIAGKGHETYQVFSHQTVPFDDRKVAQQTANRIVSS